MDTPPPPAAPGGGEDKAKRARKRSRYLTDDYETPTLLNDLHGRDDHHRIVTPPPPPRKGVVPVNEGAALLLQLHLQEANVAAADLLAALHRSATCPYDLPGPGGVDAGALLGFFALHRASVSVSVSVPSTHRGKDTTVISSSSSKDDAAAPRLNPCRAMALVHGSAGNGKEQADAVAVAMGHSAYAHHTAGPANAAAALGVAGGATGPSKRRNKKKKVTFAPGAAGCSAQPQPAATHTHIGSGITGCTPNKAASNKKATVNSSPRQGQHYVKPVALILQFAQGAAAAADQPLPSKEQLHSTFRGFGPLIEPSTEITKKQARIVFQSSAAAEAAYSCVHTLGAFAAARLQYLRPPPPAPKIPLTDVRKNLEKMIASLTGQTMLDKDSAWSLAGEMRHLLFKVDRALGAAGAGPSTSAAAHHH